MTIVLTLNVVQCDIFLFSLFPPISPYHPHQPQWRRQDFQRVGQILFGGKFTNTNLRSEIPTRHYFINENNLKFFTNMLQTRPLFPVPEHLVFVTANTYFLFLILLSQLSLNNLSFLFLNSPFHCFSFVTSLIYSVFKHFNRSCNWWKCSNS